MTFCWTTHLARRDNKDTYSGVLQFIESIDLETRKRDNSSLMIEQKEDFFGSIKTNSDEFEIGEDTFNPFQTSSSPVSSIDGFPAIHSIDPPMKSQGVDVEHSNFWI